MAIPGVDTIYVGSAAVSKVMVGAVEVWPVVVVVEPGLVNTAEGGTNGVGVTTGNSGGDSGDAWTATDSVTYTNNSIKGGLSYTSSGGQLTWEFSQTQIVARAYVKWNSNAGGIGFWDLDTFTNIASIFIEYGGSIMLYNPQPPFGYTVQIASAEVDEVYRLEIVLDTAARTGKGYVYEGDSLTLLGSDDGIALPAGLTAEALFVSMENGIVMDDIAVDFDTTTPIGPSAGALN